MADGVSRRELLGGVAAAGLGVNVPATVGHADKLALQGGTPVRSKGFPGWPVIEENDRKAYMDTLESGAWFRYNGNRAAAFEAAWARHLGAAHAVAVNSGTSALVTALHALDIGPGDEVIVPPYTFVATVNAVLLQHALPIFVDTDIDTFQIDGRKVEAAVTPKTALIIPVHIGGAPANMDIMLDLRRRNNIPILEDACQAHGAEWRGKKVGTVGDAGCFSFQGSKNLNSGEGGAVVTNRRDLWEKCVAFQNQGFVPAGSQFATPRMGCNVRLTEFQGALLSTQLTRLEEQSRRRDENGALLTSLLAEIPGIYPARQYAGATRNAYHLYMFRYDSKQFADVPRAKFLEALRAEGVPASGGYTPLNKWPLIKNTLDSKGFKRIYTNRELTQWEERNRCPVNDQLCEEAVWLSQTMLLGSKEDMEQIAEAVRKVQKNAAALK
jgi:dTDP-4-amino-4,6-dideoxygalactose transaminase